MRRNGRRWRNLRAAILSHSDICWICGEAGADTVDHVIPVAQRPDLEYEPSNLKPAHGRRTETCVGNYARTPRRQAKPNPSRNW